MSRSMYAPGEATRAAGFEDTDELCERLRTKLGLPRDCSVEDLLVGSTRLPDPLSLEDSFTLQRLQIDRMQAECDRLLAADRARAASSYEAKDPILANARAYGDDRRFERYRGIRAYQQANPGASYEEACDAVPEPTVNTLSKFIVGRSSQSRDLTERLGAAQAKNCWKLFAQIAAAAGVSTPQALAEIVRRTAGNNSIDDISRLTAQAVSASAATGNAELAEIIAALPAEALRTGARLMAEDATSRNPVLVNSHRFDGEGIDRLRRIQAWRNANPKGTYEEACDAVPA